MEIIVNSVAFWQKEKRASRSDYNFVEILSFLSHKKIEQR